MAKDSAQILFSRKDFVLALANQEGGAHVDPQIKEAYDKIANSNSMGWTYKEGNADEIPLGVPDQVSIAGTRYPRTRATSARLPSALVQS